MAGRVAYYGGISGGDLIFDLDPARRNCYNGSGITCTDLTSRYNGTLSGGVLWSDENKGVFKFDGLDEFITFGTNTPNLYPSASNFTWTGWLKYGSFTGQYRHIWYGNAGGGNPGFGIVLSNGANQIFVEVYGTLGPRQQFFNTITSYLNTWNHYAYVLNPTDYTIKLYINGVLISTHICQNWGSINKGSDRSLYIGNHQSVSWYYNGFVGPIQVYRRLLSDTEILQNYNALKGRYI